MGALVTFRCRHCGYATEELSLGPAPHPARYAPVLVSCAACQELRVVDRRATDEGCPTCKGRFWVHRDEDHVPCPRCTRQLVADMAGKWD